jgi:hypothetical protein
MTENATPPAGDFHLHVIRTAVLMLRNTRDVDSVVRYLEAVTPAPAQSDLALCDE